MIIEHTNNFTLEGDISVAFDSHRYAALGHIAIHLDGFIYGIRAADATMMGCSYDSLCRRLENRGLHLVPVDGLTAEDIAVHALTQYTGVQVTGYPGHQLSELAQWAPDGEEGFDDGSHIFHFDVGPTVRLVGFVSRENRPPFQPGSLREVWLSADEFYGVLARWKAAFEALWESMPKTPWPD